MLFIAIGIITLFASFLVALVMLIRELSQRADIEEGLINDYSLDFADTVVPTEPDIADSTVVTPEAGASLLPQEIASETSVLEEVVPYPWEAEVDADYANQIEFGKPQETEVAPSKSVLDADRKILWRNSVK